MRRTLASPNLATSSKSPAAMRGDVLSASMRIANRRVRLSSGMFGPPLFVPDRGHQYTSTGFPAPNGEPTWTGGFGCMPGGRGEVLWGRFYPREFCCGRDSAFGGQLPQFDLATDIDAAPPRENDDGGRPYVARNASLNRRTLRNPA